VLRRAASYLVFRRTASAFDAPAVNS